MSEESTSTGNTGGDGGEQTSFLDGIQSEDLRGNDALAEFGGEGKGLDDLAQAFVEMKGAQPVIPESTEEYVFDIPDGVPVDEAGLNAFKDIALEANLTADQYTQVVGYRFAEIEASNKAIETQKNEAIESLKSEFGADYETKIANGKKVLAESGVDIEALVGQEIGDDGKLLGNLPELAKLLDWVHGKMSPDTFEGGGGGGSGKEKSAAEILYPSS